MTSFKNLAILILGFALLQATLASTYCNVHLFKNSLNDGDQDKTYQYHRSSDSHITNNAPFVGQNVKFYSPEEEEERTISSFRVMVIDMDECGGCTVVGFSGKNLAGKRSEHLVDWGSDGQVNFDFCVKSYLLDCAGNHTEEEEEAEAEAEAEEEEEEQQLDE